MVARFMGALFLLYASVITPLRDCNVIYRWKNHAFCIEYSMPIVFVSQVKYRLIAAVSFFASFIQVFWAHSR